MKPTLADYWDTVYTSKPASEASWYEDPPDVSLALLKAACVGIPTPHIVDIGGGASTLVDHLLNQERPLVTVVDVAASALALSRTRLGKRASQVSWLEADITQVQILGSFDVWHDRAVYHFLVEARDRAHYASLAAESLRQGGHMILGVFAPDGPERCSGLPVRRNDAEGLAKEMGPAFSLLSHRAHVHMTPQGRVQNLVFVDMIRR